MQYGLVHLNFPATVPTEVKPKTVHLSILSAENIVFHLAFLFERKI